MRVSGRTLVVDAAGCVLLIGTVDRDLSRPAIWVPPGGGALPGEDHRAAAVRELREETGFSARGGDLVGPIATCQGPDSDEAFFLLRSEAFAVDEEKRDELECGAWTPLRWWSSDEVRATSDVVYPHGLADLLDAIARRGVPDVPVPLAWSG